MPFPIRYLLRYLHASSLLTIQTQLFVMRTDYTVRAIDHKSGEELWNATISEFSSDRSDESGKLLELCSIKALEVDQESSTDIALMASLQPNGIHAIDMKQGIVV